MAATTHTTTTLTHRRSAGPTPLGGVLVFHGHSATHSQAAQNFAFGGHPNALADEGYVVRAIDLTDAGSGSSFGSPAVTALIDTAEAAFRSEFSLSTWHALCWSAGFGGFLGWVLAGGTRAAKVDRVLGFAPHTDADWAAALAGYTPSYSTGGVSPQAGWATEYNALFSTNYAANVTAPYRLRDQAVAYAALGKPTRLIQPSDDASLPPAAAAAWVTLANAAHVTLRSPSPTGGHSAWGQVPTAEVIRFLRWGEV